MYLGIINEVMRDHRICMLPTAFQAVRNLVLNNIDSRSANIQIEKQSVAERINIPSAQAVSVQTSATVPEATVTEATVPDASASGSATDPIDGGAPASSPAKDPDLNGFINLIHLQGPMTRGGGACSYGSRDIRDYIIEAAVDPDCRGHIILTDTPGGMCSCLPDFRMAINEAHKHGQKVFMFIDGIAASCGAFVGAMCDGIYYTNPKDEIGSIGMYASFFTLADGAENKITSEVYHEYYASRSTDKNAWMRQASEGDTKQLQSEIDHDLEVLIADLSADRPSILDEQKTGKMYQVSEVVGSLVDGQSSLEELSSMLVSDYHSRNGSSLPLKEGASSDPIEPTSDPVSDGSAAPDIPHSSFLIHNSMKQYPTISAALQMGDAIMESDAENLLTLQPEEADHLEAALNDRNAQIVALNSQLTAAREAQQQAEQALAEAQQQAAAQIAAAVEAQQQAEQALAEAQQQAAAQVAAATEAQQQAEQALAEANTSHATALSAVNSQLATAQQQLSDNQQTIADLRSENERLASAPGSPVKAGAEPTGDQNPIPAAPRILNREETMALAQQQLGI